MRISSFVFLASINDCSHATVVENVGSDREKFNELQTDATGYVLAEVICKI